MKIIVSYKGIILAESNQSNLEKKEVVNTEGNYYFDWSLINREQLTLKGAGKQYYCPIKQGVCDYYNLTDRNTGTTIINEIAWIYNHLENNLYKSIEGKMAFYSHKVVIEVNDQ